MRGEEIEEAAAGIDWAHRAAEEIFCHFYSSKLSGGEIVIRVELLFTDTNLEMQMRTRSSPGRSDKSYLLSLSHLFTRPDQDPTRMGIVREYISTVINEHGLAITAIALMTACGNNGTVRACKDRTAFTRGYV